MTPEDKKWMEEVKERLDIGPFNAPPTMNDLNKMSRLISIIEAQERENENLKGELKANGYICGALNYEGQTKIFKGGCGKEVLLNESYRCSDCTASFHRKCLHEHFK